MAAPAQAGTLQSALDVLRRRTEAHDLIGLRDAIAAHAGVAVGSAELARAQSLHDELLESKVNDRHEAWLEAQEWPGKDNGYYSRCGHPLCVPLSRHWPKPTNRAPHLSHHAPETHPALKTADMRHEEWLAAVWPSEGWKRAATADHVAFTPYEFPRGRHPPPKAAPWPGLPQEGEEEGEPRLDAERSMAAIHAAMATRDVLELRDALRAHETVVAGDAQGDALLAEARALLEALLGGSANARHEARLDGQEWPAPSNGFCSRRGHPLHVPLRHKAWPSTADWPPAEAHRPPSPAAKDPFLARHQRTFEYVTVRALSDVLLTDGPVSRSRARVHGAVSSLAVDDDVDSLAALHDGLAEHVRQPGAAAADPRRAWLAHAATERNESRHQVAAASLCGKSVLGVEFHRPHPAAAAAERVAAERRHARTARLHSAVEAQTELADAAAHADAAARHAARAHGRAEARRERGWAASHSHARSCDAGYSVHGPGYRAGSAAARRASGGRPPTWPGAIEQPLPPERRPRAAASSSDHFRAMR